jgi:E3 ubiquitin-protein ligase makorin
MPGLQSLSNSSSSDTYLSDSDGDSDDHISRLGRYLRGAAGARSRQTADNTDVPIGENEEARMMREIAERGPENIEGVSGPINQIDEPQMPVMEYELPTFEDEADRGRVANPPFLTDGRGRVVWSSDREVGERANSELPPSTEMGEATVAGELQAKRSGLGSSS